MRWRHPERGLLAPGAFLPAIEQTELMRELSRRVLAMAICQAGAWFRLERPWRVAANLSATDLLDRSLVDDVSSLLRRYGTPAGRLTLEVTESVLMTDPARAMEVLGELRGLGVQLALDDFGTGWSSLTHLQRMPVHEIKIDRSFVAAMATEANSAAIVSSTVDLAHALGLRVVAEGIEDEATWRRLRAVGCDAAQGYYLSRPLPAAEFEAAAGDIAERSRLAAERSARRRLTALSMPFNARIGAVRIVRSSIRVWRGRTMVVDRVRTGQTRREAGTQSQRSLVDGSATGSPGARATDGA